MRRLSDRRGYKRKVPYSKGLEEIIYNGNSVTRITQGNGYSGQQKVATTTRGHHLLKSDEV